MKAAEMIVVARLADLYEDRGVADALDVATADFIKFKRDAPKLWRRLHASELSNREIGSWIYKFIARWERSGMSFKNFAADELERPRRESLLERLRH